MHSPLEKYITSKKLNAKFENGILVSPIPNISVNGCKRSNAEFVKLAYNKYGYKSFVEAMFNKKITLTL